MARNKRVAQVAPEPPKPLVPYVTVKRVGFISYDVKLYGLTKLRNGSYSDFLGVIRSGTFWGRERANRIAQRALNRHLRQVSYTREATTVYRAKSVV